MSCAAASGGPGLAPPVLPVPPVAAGSRCGEVAVAATVARVLHAGNVAFAG